MPLREAIAEYLGAARAVRCEPSQILVTTGSQQGLQLSAQVLLDTNERVWVEEPGYPGARQALMMAGAKLVPVPVDHEGLDVAEGIRRARSAHAVYITPSHQYPLGVTMTATRRMLLLHWAMRTGAWIIEDDYDSEYRLGGRPIASLQGLDTDARVIYIGTFSKVMFPALRLGYVVVPKDLVEAFSTARDATDQFSSTLYQAALADFIIALIAATPNVPSPQTYRTRFGSLVKAYRLSGYKAIWNERRVEQKYRVQAIRSNLLSQIAALSGGRVTIDISPTRHAQLRLRTGRLVSVIASRCLFGYNGSLR